MVAAGDEAPRTTPDPIGAAQDAASDAIGAARGAAAGAREIAQKIPKPRFRGVSHQWAAIASVPLGIALIVMANGTREIVAASIYAFSLTALLSTSAVYHRVTWQRDGARRWMRRLDHTMIFVLIAGTYTPFAVLVLEGTLSEVVLIGVWAFAAGGAVLNLAWWNAPKWFTAGVYISTGWVAVVALPQLWDKMGPVGVGMIAFGGLLYTAGAIVYATKRPDPSPEVFGYHEIFHVFVIAAAATQYAAIAFYALPGG
jgi:hemolysin III